MIKINGIMIQYFEWYMECNQNLWNQVKENADVLHDLGVTAIWLPPAYKGIGGKTEVGYGVYDLYDLGEFDQKGTIRTKYGSKDEYIEAIKRLQKAQISVYADIVLNHKMGADKIQTIPATKIDWTNHNVETSGLETVKVATKFTFPGRNNKYSDFKWNWTDFTGIDYNNETGENAIFLFKDKDWEKEVDEENGNYDYLMGADLDFSNERVVKECIDWGKWYVDTTNVDGFRLDAVKHIDAEFFKKWITVLREYSKKELYAVGEYWSGDINRLNRYLNETEGKINLFDVPLHYNLYNASIDENYDLSKIFDGTLTKQSPLVSVTFVDNHDTQPGQALSSFINEWFKEIAYSLILLRQVGYPCVFYGDLYGIPHDNIKPVENLKKLMTIRKNYIYGEEYDYFDDQNIIGWTETGDLEHQNSGCAVIISNKDAGYKKMYVGKENANKIFIDSLEHVLEEIIIDNDGNGIFKVNSKSVSVYIKK